MPAPSQLLADISGFQLQASVQAVEQRRFPYAGVPGKGGNSVSEKLFHFPGPLSGHSGKQHAPDLRQIVNFLQPGAVIQVGLSNHHHRLDIFMHRQGGHFIDNQRVGHRIAGGRRDDKLVNVGHRRAD